MKRRKTFSEINITPLTDIFLVLLIIMMVVTPMVDYKGLNLDVLSAGDAAEAAEKPKTLLVQINLLGEFTVAGAPVPKEQLADVFRQKAPECPEGVIIEIDPQTSHEAVTTAIAAAEKAAITRLALAQKEQKQAEIIPPKANKSAGNVTNPRKKPK